MTERGPSWLRRRRPPAVCLSLRSAEDLLAYMRATSSSGDRVPGPLNNWNFLYELEDAVAAAKKGSS